MKSINPTSFAAFWCIMRKGKFVVFHKFFIFFFIFSTSLVIKQQLMLVDVIEISFFFSTNLFFFLISSVGGEVESKSEGKISFKISWGDERRKNFLFHETSKKILFVTLIRAKVNLIPIENKKYSCLVSKRAWIWRIKRFFSSSYS